MEFTFSEKLRALRARAGLRLVDVAGIVNMHPATISRMEKNRSLNWKDIPFETLERFAIALKCRVEDLQNNKAA